MRSNRFLTTHFVQVVQAVYGLAAQDQTITAPVVIARTGLAHTTVRQTLATLEQAGYLVSQMKDHTKTDGRVPMQVRSRVYTLTEQGRAQLPAADRPHD